MLEKSQPRTSANFQAPVYVAVGVERSLVEIPSAAAAVRFLSTWPADQQGLRYSRVMDSLQAAMRGTFAAEDARAIFKKFAGDVGILVAH
jgi:hypothetical protein